MLAILGSRTAQDKYTVQVPNGLAFSEFRGYEGWPVIAISENGGEIAVIDAPPVSDKGLNVSPIASPRM